MNDLRIVKGNGFKTTVEVKAYRYDGLEITDFDLHACTDIKVVYRTGETFDKIMLFELGEGNTLLITWPDNLGVGKYSLEVSGKFNNVGWRFYDKQPIFTIVSTNKQANIPYNSIVKEDFYMVDKQRVYILCPKGDKGDVGPQGPQGPLGEQGAPGINGTDGIPGPKGDKGDPGERGPKGDTGDTGPLGLTGPRGPQGILGPQGEQGPLGPQGAAFTYADFTTELLAALKGPQGDPGIDGQDGQNGADGINGIDGITPHIDSTTGNWFIGTTDTGVHAQGPAGQDGSSANQLQADWNQTDNASADYIKNKPTIPTVPTNYVTTDTSLSISGEKTFTGGLNSVVFTGTNPIKMMSPNLSTTGFTFFNSSGTEKGYVQYNQKLNALFLGKWQSDAKTGFLNEPGSNVVEEIYIPTPGETGTWYIPVKITDGTTTVSAGSNGTVNMSSFGYAKVWKGTQAEYDALTTYDSNTIYIIS